MPHPNTQPTTRSVDGMRLFSVVVISTVGNEVHADTTLEIAPDAELANRAAIMAMPKGRLIQKVNAFHITRDKLEAALEIVVA